MPPADPALALLQAAAAAGPTTGNGSQATASQADPAAGLLAQAAQDGPTTSSSPNSPNSQASPTGSFLQNLAAGVGSRLADWGLGVEQIAAPTLARVNPSRFGQLPAQLTARAAEKRQLDAPLMHSWGGWVGSNATAAAPALIPGAQGLGALAAIGAAQGALTPTTTAGTSGLESRLINTGVGGALGAVGKVAGDAAGGWLARRVGAALKPALTDAQQSAIQEGEALGMRVTPGQRAGSKPLQQVEARLQSYPWTSGPFAKVSEGNQAALDRAAAQSIGEDASTVDANTMGRASERLGAVFDRVRNADRPVNVDPGATESLLDQVDAEHEGLLPGDMSIRDNKLVGQLDSLMQRAKGVEPNRDAFLSDFEKLSQPNPADPASRLLHGASVDLVRDPIDPATVHLEGITALTKRQGAGSAALRRITDLADKHGVRLTLDAQSLDSQGLPQPALEQWYGRNGFQTIASGENGFMPLMERMPITGNVTAKQLGQLSSKLGKAAYKTMTSDGGDRDLGQALYAVKDHVDDLLEGSLTGKELEEYTTARGQYRNLMTLARRGVVNPSTGHVSGAALANRLAAVDRQGFTFGKNTSPLYSGARFVQAFKPIVGDSGTATRTGGHAGLASAALLGDALARGASLEHAIGEAAIPFALRAGSNLGARAYLSPLGQASIRGLMSGAAAVSRGAAATSRSAAPFVRYGLMGAGLDAPSLWSSP